MGQFIPVYLWKLDAVLHMNRLQFHVIIGLLIPWCPQSYQLPSLSIIHYDSEWHSLINPSDFAAPHAHSSCFSLLLTAVNELFNS